MTSNPLVNLLRKVRGVGKPRLVPASATGITKLSKEESSLLSSMGVTLNELSAYMIKSSLVSYERFGFYKEVDRSLVSPLMASAVDLFAEVATTYNALANATVWVTAKDRKYENILNKFLQTVICVEEKIYDWAWTTAAYGDDFIRINAERGVGIVSIDDSAHPATVSRLDYNGRLIGFYETPFGVMTQACKLQAPWDYVHLRLLGVKQKRAVYGDPMYSESPSVDLMGQDSRKISTKYGSSVLGNGMGVYKRLRMAEDSLMLARISKGILRYIWKVKVDGDNAEAVAALMDSYKSVLKKARAMDTTEGQTFYDEKYCLVGGTKVRLLDGTAPTIQEMAVDSQKYIGKAVWSVNPVTHKLEVDEIVAVQKTRENAELVRVVLDNEEVVECTPDHPFMMRDGSFVKAECLKSGDSLMPHYEKISDDWMAGYRLVYNPADSKFHMEHRLVADAKHGVVPRGFIVHHADFNCLNNDPINLDKMLKAAHTSLHQVSSNYLRGKSLVEVFGDERAAEIKQKFSLAKKGKLKYERVTLYCVDCGAELGLGGGCFKRSVCDACRQARAQAGWASMNAEDRLAWRTKLSENATKRWSDPAFRELVDGKMGAPKDDLDFKAMRSRVQKQLWQDSVYREKMLVAQARNHKVLMVVKLEHREDTYDIETKRNHNFPLAAGVFVHNSPLGVNEDVILPVWGDVNDLTFEKIGGEADIRFIADIDELRNQLACALRVPLHMLGGYTESVPGGMNSTALERYDIRFARQARRLQRAMIDGVTRLCQIHLAYQGMNPDSSLFDVNMAETSTAEEEELRDALDKATDVVDKLVKLVVDTLGEGVDRKALLKYANKKILKLDDFNIDEFIVGGSEAKKVDGAKTDKAIEMIDEMASTKIKLPHKKLSEVSNGDTFAACPSEIDEREWIAKYGTTKINVELTESMGRSNKASSKK